jgi:hypothetical protein
MIKTVEMSEQQARAEVIQDSSKSGSIVECEQLVKVIPSHKLIEVILDNKEDTSVNVERELECACQAELRSTMCMKTVSSGQSEQLVKVIPSQLQTEVTRSRREGESVVSKTGLAKCEKVSMNRSVKDLVRRFEQEGAKVMPDCADGLIMNAETKANSTLTPIRRLLKSDQVNNVVNVVTRLNVRKKAEMFKSKVTDVTPDCVPPNVRRRGGDRHCKPEEE